MNLRKKFLLLVMVACLSGSFTSASPAKACLPDNGWIFEKLNNFVLEKCAEKIEISWGEEGEEIAGIFRKMKKDTPFWLPDIVMY